MLDDNPVRHFRDLHFLVEEHRTVSLSFSTCRCPLLSAVARVVGAK